MKVLSIHWGFSIGGVGKYASLIDNIVDTENVDILNIVILNKSRQIDVKTLDLLKNKSIIYRNGIFDLSWVKSIKEAILKYNPKAIMSHGFNGHFVAYIIKILVRPECQYVASYHGSYHATTKARKIAGWFYNKFAEHYLKRCASSIISVADYCKVYLQRKGVESEKIRVIHNGIDDIVNDDLSRAKLRNEWSVKDNDLLIGVASRIDPVKGIEYLLDAYERIADEFSYVKLAIIGTGTLENEFKKRISNKGLANRVIFTGFRSDIPACLNAMDIFALPSLAEYHSIALLEAMRAGKAIISTDVGGNTESVRDEKDGLIVQSADSNQLYDALVRYITDESLRTLHGESARNRFVSNFTVDKMASDTRDWFAELNNG